MNQKAFLGPIGDDLPSLIPLIFALIVFFGVFNLALNIFDSKSEQFNADISVLQIANGLRGTGYITDYDHFQETCASLNIRRIKYVAGLVDLNTTPDAVYMFPDMFDLQYLENNEGEKFSCSNLGEGEEASVPEGLLSNPQQEVVSRIYPMVLDFQRSDEEGDSVVRPVQLVVVAWH